MHSIRAALRAARLAALCLVSSACLLADSSVVDEQFADGNRSSQNPPASVNWFVNTGSSLTATMNGGALQLNNPSSRLLVGYLGNSAVSVAQGQAVTLEIFFRSDVAPAAVTNGFNLALFNSGGTRIAGDFSGTSNAAFASYDGYGVKTSGLGSTSGSNVTLRQRNLGTSTALMSTSGDWATLASGSGSTTAAAANIDYVATFSVTNNGASVALSYTLKTADGLTTLQSLSGNDSSTLATNFDTVALYAQTNEFPAGNLLISRIRVSLSGDAAAQAPQITAHPQSQSANLGDNVSFSVSATGTAPLTYQWFKGVDPIGGATSATLPLTNVQSSDEGSYTVTVTNAAGSATSNAAVLTVNTTVVAPAITTQPVSQSVNVGGSVTFTVGASGTAPLSYAWQKAGSPIPGATGASLILNNVQTDAAGNYSVVVSNSAGSAPSDEATLTVNVVAPVITKQPSNQTVAVGSSAAFTVVATGSAPLTYQWYKGVDPIPGATNASLAFSSVQPDDAGEYFVTVTNSTATATSNKVALAVADEPTGLLSRFNLTGFATQGSGTTGGGVIPESDPAYVKVTTPFELANALIAASKTAGAVKVIEIMNDLDLGWKEIGTAVQTLASNPFRAHAAPKLHPVLLVTGVSIVDIKPKSGLTIFSANGATIRHCNFNVKSTSNIIIRNLKFAEAWEWDEATKGDYDSNDWDFITLGNGGVTTNVWVDHCTFTKAYDGIMDQKAGTQYVTLSWCKYVGDDGATNPNSWVRQQIAALESNRAAYPFYNFLRNNGFSVEDVVQVIQGHDKTHLMGSNSLDADNATLSATLHHLWLSNMWDRCVPRLRAGNVHNYNLYVDDTQVLAAKRLRDARAAALTSSLRNTLNSTYSFNPPINGCISTEGGAVLLERSVYTDCVWPLRNNQTDPSNSVYTGKIQASDTIYVFHNTDGSIVNVRGNSTDAGNPMGPFQAAIIPFSWNLAGGALPYSYTTDDPAQLLDILKDGAGAGTVAWAKENWLKTTYVDPVSAPVIATQPVSATVTVGDSAAFSVAANGAGPFTYQWSKDNTPIQGANEPTLNLASVTTDAAGSYDVTVSNGAFSTKSASATLVVNKATSTVQLAGLSATYDGSPKAASISTTPSGLAVIVTYDGNAPAPTNAGSYTVAATVNDANYVGSASGTLVIDKAPASVTLGSLSQVFDGLSKTASAETSPAGLTVALTYDGSASAPTNAGTYAVVGTVVDTNYAGSANATLVVDKAAASVALGGLSQVYDGSPRLATASTTPAGLPVVLTYDGSASAPVNAGSYAVFAAIDRINYAGSTSGTLQVAKAVATVSLTPLKRSYTGNPVTVGATTSPTGLSVDLTYDGQASGPIYPGPHTVIATVNEANYVGTTTQTLVITTTALVRHAPTLNGMIDGSIQLLSPEGVTFNNGSALSGDLLVRGTPTVQANTKATLAGIKDGPGAATPTNYAVSLGSGAVVRYVVRRIDPIGYPTVSAPPLPSGSRDVSLSGSNKNAGDFGTVRNLTLNNGAGNVAVPPGTYGAFTSNGNTSFVLGVAGATEAAVYNLQSLTVNNGSSLQIVGPVVLTLANGTTLGGSVGNAARPEWLTLRVASGGLTLNSGVAVRGAVVVPNGTLTLNGTASIFGELVSDRLSVSSGGFVDEFTQ